MPRVYVAQPMSGRLWADLEREAQTAIDALDRAGLRAWSPVLSERDEKDGDLVSSVGVKKLSQYWGRDYRAMKKCDALLSIRGDIPSEGVGFEIGVAKYALEIPVAIVVPVGATTRITHIGALLAKNVEEAARLLAKRLR